jgi:hypothetical protein
MTMSIMQYNARLQRLEADAEGEIKRTPYGMSGAQQRRDIRHRLLKAKERLFREFEGRA